MVDRIGNPQGRRNKSAADNPKPKNTKANQHYEETKRDLDAIKARVDALTDAINAKNREAEREPKEGKWAIRGSVAGIVYAGLTIIIVLTGFYQGYLSRQALVAGNRAWIAPEFMTLREPIESGTIKYQLHVENTGHQPVMKGVYRFHAFTVPHIAEGTSSETDRNLPANRTCDGLEYGKAEALVLYQGTSTKFWLTGNWTEPSDEKAVAAELLARTGSLIVEGCILYDTMDGQKFSAFRFFLRDIPGASFTMQKGDDGKTHPAPAWMFNLTGTGNNAD